jgi:hypothetical protein
MRLPAIFRSLLIIAVLAPLFGSRPAHAQAVVPIRLRIGVTADNLYRIVPTDLTTAGVGVSTVHPSTFALSSRGQPVALRVVDANNNNIFDGSDFIEFFGQKFRSTLPDLLDRQMEEKYTDEQVYWLDIGGATGLRVTDVPNAPPGNLTSPTSFPTTVHAEVNRYWMPLWSLNYDTRDTWYWDYASLSSSTATPIERTLTYTTPYPDPAADLKASVRLEALPIKTTPAGANPSHRVTLTLGSTQVADSTWSGGLVRQVISGIVPAGLLTSPTTSLKARVSIQTPSTQDLMLLNFWEVDYRRLFRAYGDQLDFQAEVAGTQDFSATDFTSSAVAVWDITSPLQPKRLRNVAPTGAGPYTARFRATPAKGDRFWMQGEGSFAAPASIVLRSSTAGLRYPAGGADTIIVRPALLRSVEPSDDPAERLAAWHRAHGRRTVVVDLQDVYDEFNNGIRHPVAVRQMTAWAAANWAAPAPAYLVLMGDGHLNLKGFAAADPRYAAATNPFPPYLIFKDPWFGEIASDGLYGDITGDDLPDVAVGRIPANTLAEANTIVSKIVGYDETGRTQTWQQQAVFVADRQPDPAGYFWDMSNEVIAGNLPADLSAQRIYYSSTDVPTVTAARTTISNAINGGALMVQFTGHGTTQWWSDDKIWRVADVPQLTNTAMLPVIMSFNCLDGFFIYSSSANQGLEETMLRSSTGGSVAAIAPSGEGLTFDQQIFRKILMDTLFKDGVRDLGRAMMITKRDYAFDPNARYAAYGAPRGVNYLAYSMNLFGDPALKIPAPCAVSDTTIRRPTATTNVQLNWTAIPDSASYNVHRSNTNPYFDPGPSTLVQNVGMPTFTDPGAIGNPALNKYYVMVTGFGVCGQNPPAGAGYKRTGEFSFALKPGS